MRLAGVPKDLAEWFGCLSRRRTILTFDDYRSPPKEIRTGIMQRCPSSVIAFLFYHAGLSHITRGKVEACVSFVDNLMYMAEGETRDDVNYKLWRIME